MSGMVFAFIKILGNESSIQILLKIFTVAKFTPNNYVRVAKFTPMAKITPVSRLCSPTSKGCQHFGSKSYLV